LGFAAATKFSMVALAPVVCVGLVALFAFAPRLGLRRANVLGQACALALAAVFAVNAAYFFRHREPDSLDTRSRARSSPRASPSVCTRRSKSASRLCRRSSRPTSSTASAGNSATRRRATARGCSASYSRQGWWYYFPVAFALKTPLPVLLLSLGGLVWAVLRLRRARDARLLLLLLPPAFFTCLLMLSTINIGVRYYLPAYTFFFVAAGAMLDDLLARARRAGWRSPRGVARGVRLLLGRRRGRARVPGPHELHEPVRLGRAALVVSFGLERRVGRRRARPRAILARARRDARGRGRCSSGRRSNSTA
jgi:hypothetical protein